MSLGQLIPARVAWAEPSIPSVVLKVEAAREVGAGSMKDVAQYREFADECRRLAAEASDRRFKQALELMASAWEDIANRQEAYLSKQGDRRCDPD
jgi:hypothetical protein